MSDAAQAAVIRFDALEPLTKHPPDTRLERYQRERFAVLGRAKERLANAPGAETNFGVNFGYLKCAPGKGNCSHHHPDWEVFIPLSGKWRLVVEAGELESPAELTLDAWDMIIVPPNTFHEATNISGEDAWMLSLNPGNHGAPYTLHPEVVAALQHLDDVKDAARHGLDV